jgi:protein-tyrosine-phosphatase
MAEALMWSRLAERGCDGDVTASSAGFGTEGIPVRPEVLQVMTDASAAAWLHEHRSRRVTPEMVLSADMTVTMTRQHMIEIVTTTPEAWSKTFTLSDLARRAASAGPRRPGEGLDSWVERVHAGRTRLSAMALATGDDIADPIGGRLRVYEATCLEIDRLVTGLAYLMCPGGGAKASR